MGARTSSPCVPALAHGPGGRAQKPSHVVRGIFGRWKAAMHCMQDGFGCRENAIRTPTARKVAEQLVQDRDAKATKALRAIPYRSSKTARRGVMTTVAGGSATPVGVRNQRARPPDSQKPATTEGRDGARPFKQQNPPMKTNMLKQTMCALPRAVPGLWPSIAAFGIIAVRPWNSYQSGSETVPLSFARNAGGRCAGPPDAAALRDSRPCRRRGISRGRHRARPPSAR